MHTTVACPPAKITLWQSRLDEEIRLHDLLASLDEAGTGQADPGGDPPHAYIPAGPVEAARTRVTARPRSGGRRSRRSWRASGWALTTRRS
jgi:hypothetical protein